MEEATAKATVAFPADAASTDFASVLKRLRKERGLSQEALAERAAISTQAVTALECGLRKSPYPRTIALLSEALGLDDAGRAALEAAAAANRAARNSAAETREAGAGDLPALVGAVIGRESVVHDVAAALLASRLVTLAGLGGIGKTTVAVAAARAVHERFSEGVFFCDLSSLSDGAQVATRIAAARGVMLRDGRDTVQSLASALKASSVLLVLDNCEHLVEDVAAVIHRLLTSCPQIAILATSRRRLGVTAERIYHVPPLAESAALALFVQRATAVNAAFALTDESAQCVARICRRLDGIALAIELAAAQVRLMSVDEIERRLGERFRMLRDAPGADRAHPRTLLAAFDWSYELLSEAERRFFRALGIFAGTFSLDSALEICCAEGADELNALDLLASLVDGSLVVVELGRTTTRYRLLETTRAYAAAALACEGEHADLAARHLAYYRRHATGLDFILELEDIRSALRWALDGGDAAAGADLLALAGAQWSLLGLAAEGAAWIEAFLPAVEPDDAATHARALVTLAMLRAELLRWAPAFADAKKSVAYARRAGDDAVLFAPLRALATIAALCGDLATADATLAEVADVAARAPTPMRSAIVPYTRGIVLRAHGDLDAAVLAFREALHAASGLELAYIHVLIAGNIADALHEAGRTAEAIAEILALQDDPVLREYQDGAVLANLCGYYVSLGDDDAAFAAAQELFALRGARPTMRVYTTVALEHVALAHAHTGAEARAARIAGYCDECVREIGHERHYTERRTHERLNALLERRFPAVELAALKAEGASLSEEGAVRLHGGK